MKHENQLAAEIGERLKAYILKKRGLPLNSKLDEIGKDELLDALSAVKNGEDDTCTR